nr:hypothetical protein CFP56_05549 [Quercus suber]
MQSCVVEGLKKESMIEYTNKAENAFIDFPIGVSTNYSSEFTGLIFPVFFARHIIEEPCTPEESCVVEGLKKESMIEYTNKAENAFIDFPIGVSTNYSSEFTGLIFPVFFARHIIEEPCTPEESPFLTAPPPLEVLRVESPPPEAPLPLPKPLPSSDLSPLTSD